MMSMMSMMSVRQRSSKLAVTVEMLTLLTKDREFNVHGLEPRNSKTLCTEITSYVLSSVNQSNAGQSCASVRLCIQKKVDSAFCLNAKPEKHK